MSLFAIFQFQKRCPKYNFVGIQVHDFPQAFVKVFGQHHGEPQIMVLF